MRAGTSEAVPVERTIVPVRAQTGALLRQEDGDKLAPNGERYDHRFVASTERLASDGGVIPVRAWDVRDYVKRPRWISSHDIWGSNLPEIVLGRTVHVAVEEGLPKDIVGPTGRGLVAYVRYASTPLAQQVRMLYDEGGLDDVSVRWDWRTEEVRDPTADEIAAYADQSAEAGVPLRWWAERVALVELSAVLFGADAGAKQLRWREPVEAALAACRSKGHTMDAVEALRVARDLPDPAATLRLDQGAIMDATAALGEAATKLDSWAAGLGAILQQVRDQVTGLQNLVGDVGETAEPAEAAGDDEDRSAGSATARGVGDVGVDGVVVDDGAARPSSPTVEVAVRMAPETAPILVALQGVADRIEQAVARLAEGSARAETTPAGVPHDEDADDVFMDIDALLAAAQPGAGN